MSEMVKYKGKLKLIKRNKDETLNEQIIRMFSDSPSWNKKFHDEEPKDYILDNFWNKDGYIVVNGDLYECTVENCDLYEDIYSARKVGEEIEYEVSYYNGGTCLSEALEEALETIKISSPMENLKKSSELTKILGDSYLTDILIKNKDRILEILCK